jgi:NAD(P)-dependent dehydrogenase (short-subunit alcohol dehydrogenase family)
MPALSSSSSSPSRKTWFITGCSSGIGRELVLAALAHGDNVVATARKVSTMEDLKQLGALTLTLDVTSFGEVLQKTVVQAVEVYGTIDILVNNAGYFLEGAVEECRYVLVA